jgi:hypothetical protein
VKTIDPSDPLLKKQIKASITAAIVKEVVGSNYNEIAQRVEEAPHWGSRFCAYPIAHGGVG